MPDRFVPLHVALAVPVGTIGTAESRADANQEAEPRSPTPHAETTGAAPADAAAADAAAEVRRFRAALADAMHAQLDDLLRDLACDVLARELALAPADVAAVAGAALERFACETPLRLRAHPDDVAALEHAGVPAWVDASLRRGDVVVELRYGTIDARLGTRLATVLARR